VNTLTRTTSLALISALSATIFGCSSTATIETESDYQIDVTHTGPDESYLVTRRIAGVSQAALLYTRSVHVEPVVRPFSYLSSGYSLVLKSVGGALRRRAINTLQMPALTGDIPAITYAEEMNIEEWERKLDRITGTKQDRGTIEFLVDGEQYFDRLENAILSAAESIDMRTYIFDNDDYAVAVADSLKSRANDNVRVRIMIDTLGNMQAMQVDSESMPESHRAPLSMAMYLQLDSKVKVRTWANAWFAGDHVKTTIFDGEVAFVGGMNIGREYRYEWHDLMMEVRGPIVNQLQFESDKAWARASPFGDVANLFAFLKGKPNKAGNDGYPIRVLRTKNFDSDIYRAQMAAIQNAQSYILIENAYFSDDRTLFELARARRRGVDVRVIMPAVGNHGTLQASNRVAINQMLEHGIRVYRYPGMSHVKAAIFDGWACMGSANFDKMSLKINKELNLATSDESAVSALMAQVFIPDLMASEEITSPVNVSLATKLAEVIVDEML